MKNSDTLQICKLKPSNSQSVVVTHSLTICDDLTWTAFVHGHHVDGKKSRILSAIPTKLDSESLNSMLLKLDQCTVCPGHPDKHFVEMVLLRKGMVSKSGEVVATIDSYSPVHLNGETYTQTVRNRSCEIIVRGVKCSHCIKYRSTLRKSYHRWNIKRNTSPSKRISPSSRSNVRFLSTPEKQQRYKNLKARSDAAEKKLKKMIEKSTHQQGLTVEPQIHNELEEIMNIFNEEVSQKHPEGFRRLFWEQQLQSIKAKDRRQIRWHPTLIKWCLHLKYKSASAYHALRSTGCLTLPSERTLRDYTHWAKVDVGFSAEANERIIHEACIKEEKDKYVVLVFDEMKIREDLVFDKHSCELVGFVDIGEINNILAEVERQCTDDSAMVVTQAVATHMLTFMVRGIFTKLEHPFAQFATRDLSAGKLFPLVWDAVRNLELCGFKVIAIVCDGAAANRKFFKMHGAAGKMGDIVYKTINPYSNDNREIFFLSDVPHLIKTARNCWSNSFAHNHARPLWVSYLSYF